MTTLAKFTAAVKAANETVTTDDSGEVWVDHTREAIGALIGAGASEQAIMDAVALSMHPSHGARTQNPKPGSRIVVISLTFLSENPNGVASLGGALICAS